jgi:sodium/hydrogen antiporter
VLAAADGFSFAEPWGFGLGFAGLAVFAAVAALSHQQERAFSAAAIYLGIGLAGALLIEGLGVKWLDPVADAKVVEHLAEIAVIVALFATGLKVDRDIRDVRSWSAVARLLLIALPLTIAVVALWGSTVMGLGLAAAIGLGAILAPTDPVLAGDVGIGPPGEEEHEAEPNFALTAEAGLNDGLAYPFVLLAVFVGLEPGAGWLGTWALADVGYAIAGGVLIGAVAGFGAAALIAPLRQRDLLVRHLDGWMAIAVVLTVYGLTEIAGAYGFIAAFVGGLAFRRYEQGHEMHRGIHDSAETVEKFGELSLILLLGSLVTLDGLGAPRLEGWLLVPLLLLVVRPLVAFVSLAGTRPLPRLRERCFVAFFGVRGIGSLYYGAVLVGSGALSGGEAATVFWTMAAVVIVSIFLHGVSASPLARRLLEAD